MLAIFGNSEGIDLEVDRQYLENFPNAKIRFLIEPTLDRLGERLWDDPWDIMYFGGHSFSNLKEKTGWIYLYGEQLKIEKINEYFNRAAKKGLKLAIFNSCAGLGLARVLIQANIPYVIAMGQPVSDLLAQTFLKYFLKEFSGGASIYSAFATARIRLQILESIPGATEVPVLCQHPEAKPFTWPREPKWLNLFILVSLLVGVGIVYGNFIM